MDAVDSRKRRREPSSVFSISCVPATDNLVFGCLRQTDVAAHTTTTAPLGLHALTPQQRAVLVRDPSSSRARVSRYYAGEAAASPNVGQFRKRTSQNRNTGQAPGAQQQFVPLDPFLDREATPVSDLRLFEPGEDRLQRRARLLNQATRERPEDERTWLALAASQCASSRAATLPGGGTLPVGAATKAVLEKQLSIIERGLQFCARSWPLREEQLTLSAKMYDHARADELWQAELAERGSDEPDAWRAYIRFRRSHFGSFSLTSMRDLTARALRALERSALRPELASRFIRFNSCCSSSAHRLSPNIRGRGNTGQTRHETGCVSCALRIFDSVGGSRAIATIRRMVELIVDLCVLERSAGYEERARAVFQALVELNLNQPDEVKVRELMARGAKNQICLFTPFHRARASCPSPCVRQRGPWPAILYAFEEYWESEAPRIGETVSSVIEQPPPLVGWRAWKAGIVSSLEVHTSSTETEPPLRASAAAESHTPLSPQPPELAPEGVARFSQRPPTPSAAPMTTLPFEVDDSADRLGEGLRSLADDGTVYSLKHGHRIAVARQDTARGSNGPTPYERILAELRDEKEASGATARQSEHMASSVNTGARARSPWNACQRSRHAGHRARGSCGG